MLQAVNAHSLLHIKLHKTKHYKSHVYMLLWNRFLFSDIFISLWKKVIVIIDILLTIHIIILLYILSTTRPICFLRFCAKLKNIVMFPKQSLCLGRNRGLTWFQNILLFPKSKNYLLLHDFFNFWNGAVRKNPWTPLERAP